MSQQVVDFPRRPSDNRRMKMMWFHLMPYPKLPEDFNTKHRSVWVDIDPALFDRDVMAETYDTYIDQLVYAEDCGFDGICVNEHHNNGYGLMPSPNLIAADPRQPHVAGGHHACSATRWRSTTRRCALPRSSPCSTCSPRGRLIAGFPVGTAMDTTHSYSMNPGTLRPRYYEGID